jgi:hypothetical protein
MTQLELYQRGLLDLVKKRGPAPSDPYLLRVAESRQLGVVQEIAVWWRLFQIEAQCHFTALLLKRFGRFHETVISYFNANRTSPFVEELSRDFLGSLQADDHLLVRTVAQFESAFQEARSGSSQCHEIVWDRHPDRLLHALHTGAELPEVEPESLYRMKIAGDLPGMVVCTREQRLGTETL